MKRIYLDYASTTPLDKRVLKKMLPYLGSVFANPSSLYKEGVEARKAINSARKEIAVALNALPENIIFTGSGTESNNMAIIGCFNEALLKNSAEDIHFITSSIEHPSVLETCKAIEKRGAKVTYVQPRSDGIISPEEIKKALRKNTVLVSIMYANNEIGTINPLKEIAKVIRKFRKDKDTEPQSDFPYFHTDASQAANYLDINVLSLNVDMMTLDASKIYGPKGIGLLYKRASVELSPLMFGGSQEKNMRPGTENVASIVGMSESLKIARDTREKESNRLTVLRDYFISKAMKIPGVSLNGSSDNRLPNNINICIDGMDSEYAVFLLDAAGICVSSVTSCRSLTEESSSYVVESLGNKNKECATSSLRITLGRGTSKRELDALLKALSIVIDKAKKKLIKYIQHKPHFLLFPLPSSDILFNIRVTESVPQNYRISDLTQPQSACDYT